MSIMSGPNMRYMGVEGRALTHLTRFSPSTSRA